MEKKKTRIVITMDTLINEKQVWMWIRWNEKRMTADNFFIETGMQPMEFFKKNKDMCLAMWKFYTKTMGEVYKSQDKEKKLKEKCKCEKNDSDKSREIIWKCPIHGNCWNGIRNKDLAPIHQ